MTKEEIIKWALSKGWTLDRFGHLQRRFDGKLFRLKLSKNSVRHEVKVHHKGSECSKPSLEWVYLAGSYYKDAHLTSDGTLTLTRVV